MWPVARTPVPVLLRDELGLGDTPLVVLSAGGGNVDGGLTAATIEASATLAETCPHRLCVFTGPYAPEERVVRCLSLAEGCDWITLRRFTKRFPDYLAAADLSVSLGGYNTTMNLLAANTRSLMLPFMQNREQNMRAERFGTAVFSPCSRKPTLSRKPFPGAWLNRSGPRCSRTALI